MTERASTSISPTGSTILERGTDTPSNRWLWGCGQLGETGFETYLIACLDLNELDSETLVFDAIYNATQRGELNSRMCNSQCNSGGLLDRHIRLHKTPV